MTKRNDGGMASAMTLRDHLAGLAMAGLVNHWSETGHTWAEIAEEAYGVADKMLVERLKGRAEVRT